MWQLLIFMELEPFSYYFGIMKRLYMSTNNLKLRRLTNIYPENIKVSMGQMYPYSTRQREIFVLILHIYGARDIFLLFCDYQDTESE